MIFLFDLTKKKKHLAFPSVLFAVWGFLFWWLCRVFWIFVLALVLDLQMETFERQNFVFLFCSCFESTLFSFLLLDLIWNGEKLKSSSHFLTVLRKMVRSISFLGQLIEQAIWKIKFNRLIIMTFLRLEFSQFDREIVPLCRRALGPKIKKFFFRWLGKKLSHSYTYDDTCIRISLFVLVIFLDFWRTI